jgi:hypothetical protein
MDPKDAALIAIGQEESGQIIGRTLLQKKLYFAAVLAEQELGFRPHYYGPYSPEVADAVDSLVANRFLKETTETFPGQESIFGEWRRHSYELTADGDRLLEALGDTGEARKLREALEKVNAQPIASDFNLLSVAAKVHVLLREKSPATASEIRRKALEYGWQLSEQQIEDVARYLVDLGLATLRKRPP